MNTLISIDELKIATGYSNAADVEKCLQRNGVRVIYGKKGYIFTTIDAINTALGLQTNQQSDTINFLDE
jgi:hypothetical protein